MPHQTFFNLPEDKRQQILQVAIDEFAENDYDNVSISRIVTRTGIAKGSFYQYFADKEDLYAYLLGMLAEAKREFMSLDHPDPSHVGIFAYLRWMAEVGVAFQLAYPQLSKIAVRATNANFFPKAVQRQHPRADAGVLSPPGRGWPAARRYCSRRRSSRWRQSIFDGSLTCYRPLPAGQVRQRRNPAQAGR